MAISDSLSQEGRIPLAPVLGRAGGMALASLGLGLAYWLYWTLFPTLPAGMIGNDALFLADGARRLALGHAPHADFSLPTGVLTFLGWFWAERLFPQFPAYIGMHLIGYALLLPALAVAAAQLPGRLAPLALIVLTGIVTLLPFNLEGGDFYGIDFHASYNRLATGLGLVYCAWLVRAGRDVWRDGLVLAYLLVVALFLKIVLIGLVVGPVLVLAVFSAHWRRAGLFAMALAAGALGLAELAGGGILSAYLADVAAMSAVNGPRAPYFLASFLFKTLIVQALVGALVVWMLAERFAALRAGRAGWSDLALPLAMLAAMGGVALAESQATGGLEFTAALGLLFAPGLCGRPASPARLALAAGAAGLLAGTLVVNAFERGAGALLERHGPGVALGWVERYLPNVVVPESLLERALARDALWREVPEMLAGIEAEGHELVDRSDVELYLVQWLSVDAALLALDVADPGAVLTLSNVELFGLALGAEPVRGTHLVHDVGRSVGVFSQSEAADYLAGADTVFAPTCAIAQSPGLVPFAPLFSAALAAGFEPTVLTPCWTMHRRSGA